MILILYYRHSKMRFIFSVYFGTALYPGWRLLLGAFIIGLLFALRRMSGLHLVRLGLFSFGQPTLGLS